jgi:hypothetical protein
MIRSRVFPFQVGAVPSAAVLLFGVLAVVGPLQAQTFSSIPALSFTKVYSGANPLPQVMVVTSTGANLAFDVSPTTVTGGSWLTTTSCGSWCTTPEALTVTVNPAVTLAAGTYAGQILISVHGNPSNSMTVPVTLTVAAAGTAFFDDVPGQMSFSFATGSGTTPPAQSIQIRDGGAGTLNWTASASTADGGGWLSVSALSGTAPSTVTVSLVTSSLPGGGLTPGTYIGQLAFAGAGGGVTIPVSVVVGSAVFEQVNAIGFTKPFGGANPLPQVLTLASTGADFAFDSAVNTGNGSTWLTITSCGSWCTTPEAITVAANPAVTLAAGTYTAQITFTVHGSRTMALTVPVTLTVGASNAPFFDNVPGQLTYSLLPGAGAPAAQTVQIRKAGTGALSWTAAAITADGGNWLAVSPPAGTAPTTVTVSVTPGFLPGGGILAGTYTGQVSFVAAGSSVTIPVSVVVGDSVFEQVNPIAFTKPFGGSNPLPQILSIASTGADFAFDAVANTANGGAWLTITSCGSWCTTPEAITVTANPAVTLAAGTYTAQVTFTIHGSRSMAMTVPVTLTVAGSGPFFDSLPGQLSFSLLTAGNAPPSQTIQIRNGGTGTLKWSAQTSTSDGGNWLKASSLSGTAPSNVAITISPVNLPNGGIVGGTFTGQLSFRSAKSTVTIPVTVVVGDSVFRQANPINFTKPLDGSNPLPQILNVASTGSDFAFDAVAVTANGGAWLQITSCGSWCTTPEAISVAASPAVTLAAGTYSGEIVFTVHGSRNIAMTVPVTLTIAPPTEPFFDSLAGQLSFSLLTAGNAPPCQSIQIRNGGTGTLTWTAKASTSDGGTWLSVSPASGTAPATITVCISPAALPGGALLAGTFTGQLRLQSADSVVTIPIGVVVGSSVFQQVNPITFTKPFGGANPLAQILSIASNGSDFAFDAVAATANGGAWLQITSCGSWCTTPEAITVAANPAVTLAAGTYSGEVVFTVHGSRTISMTVPVTLTVAATTSPFFDSEPGEISFSFQTAGSTPPAQTFQIRNGGAETLSWSATVSTADGGAWLKLSAKTGTAPVTLTASIVPSALPGGGLLGGTFTGQLAFSASGSSVTIPVSVVVGDNVFRQVNPLSFTQPSGGANPLPQYISIASTGASFAFDAVAIDSNGGAWLQITSCGSWCTTPEVITVAPNPAVTLAAGTYTAEIVFTVHGSRSMAMTVPVTLMVAASNTAFFDNTPGQVTFSMQPGGAAPASQSIQLRDDGSGTLTWTAKTSTADGGQWLNLSPRSGTATSNVTVSVVPAHLPGQGLIAGTFVGQVMFSAPTGSITIPVTVTVGTDVFVQAKALTFSKPFGGPNPASQQITGASMGANFAFDDVVATANGGNWLQITSCGSWCTTPQAITATVNAAATLPAGTYTGQITFVVHGSRTMSMAVPVTLKVN